VSDLIRRNRRQNKGVFDFNLLTLKIVQEMETRKGSVELRMNETTQRRAVAPRKMPSASPAPDTIAWFVQPGSSTSAKTQWLLVTVSLTLSWLSFLSAHDQTLMVSPISVMPESA